MKKLFLILLVLFLMSCTSGDHFHDGKYFTKVELYGMEMYNVNYRISGSEIIVDNSVTGISRIQCQQYEDRIEFSENGTIKIITVLGNGDLNVGGDIILRKVQ